MIKIITGYNSNEIIVSFLRRWGEELQKFTINLESHGTAILYSIYTFHTITCHMSESVERRVLGCLLFLVACFFSLRNFFKKITGLDWTSKDTFNHGKKSLELYKHSNAFVYYDNLVFLYFFYNMMERNLILNWTIKRAAFPKVYFPLFHCQ